MLDYSRAPWRKLHVGDHPEWIALSWQARTVLLHLFRAVDSEGKLDMGRAGPKAVAGLVRLPWEVFEPGYRELREASLTQESGTWISLPWFEESQDTPTCGVIRTQMWREKKRDATSQIVTRGDAVRRGVTNVTRRGEERREEETRGEEKRPEPEGDSPPARRNPSKFREALNRMAATSGGLFLGLTGDLDVEASQAIRFLKGLRRSFPEDHRAWPLAGEYLLKSGRHAFGNEFTAEDFLHPKGAEILKKAVAWEDLGRPAFQTSQAPAPKKTYVETEEERERTRNRLEREARLAAQHTAAAAANNGGTNGIAH
jgi:hypothetical protein